MSALHRKARGSACAITLAITLVMFTGFAPVAQAQSATSLRVSGEVQQATCVLQNGALTLPDVRADLVGSPSARLDFDVTMTCPMAGIELVLTLRDAGDPDFNVGFHLARHPGSTASGVAIGLLRNNLPVAFTTPWTHGRSVVGQNIIPLTAAYVRTREPAVVPGSIGGVALLEAEYR